MTEGYAVSGYLLENPNSEIKRSDLDRCADLSFVSNITHIEKSTNTKTVWEEFQFTSRTSLRSADQVGQGPYNYRVICKRNEQRIILVSESKDVIDHLIKEQLLDVFPSGLLKVPIAVDRLVKDLTKQRCDYALSYTHARIDAFGEALSSASFYGKDIAESRMLRENLEIMSFITCGLKEVVGGGEILKIGNDGSISFKFTHSRRIREVQKVMFFLRENAYVPDRLFEE